MNDFLKYALLGVGGYFLYEYLMGGTATAVAAPTPSNSIAPAGTVSAPNPTPAPAATSTIVLPSASDLINAASLDGYTSGEQAGFNIYEWNYYYTKVTGRSAGFLFAGSSTIAGTTVLGSASAYLQALSSWASSPQYVSGSLGRIINLQDMPTPSELGWGVGDDEFAYGLGRILMGAKPGTLGFRGLGGIVDAPENNAAYIDQNVFVEAAGTNGGLDSSSQDFYLAAGLPIS